MSRLGSVQANLLSSYRHHAAARYLFVKVGDARRARRWLQAQLRSDSVTFHDLWHGRAPALTMNVAFTYQGLIALEVQALRLAHLEAFSEGMAARSTRLGDIEDSAPGNWQQTLLDHHMLVVLTARESEQLDARQADLLGELARAGMPDAHVEQAARLEGGIEHFGFRDGFSQPAVENMGNGAPVEGEGTLTASMRWRKLATGEFVLGYRDEGGGYSPAPFGPLGDRATFMVVRKLAQHVAEFRRRTEEAAARLGRETEWLRSRMVGRWPNGSPLELHPSSPGPQPQSGEQAGRFHYGSDPDGLRCPLGAHVRRSNPRDSVRWQGRLSCRHRLIRRGMPYGTRLPAHEQDEQRYERGILFVCYQASIERQFEFVQQRWLADGNALQLGRERDPLLSPGAREGSMVIEGRPPTYVGGLRPFVTTRGGGYHLLPSRPGLAALAANSC